MGRFPRYRQAIAEGSIHDILLPLSGRARSHEFAATIADPGVENATPTVVKPLYAESRPDVRRLRRSGNEGPFLSTVARYSSATSIRASDDRRLMPINSGSSLPNLSGPKHRSYRLKMLRIALLTRSASSTRSGSGDDFCRTFSRQVAQVIIANIFAGSSSFVPRQEQHILVCQLRQRLRSRFQIVAVPEMIETGMPTHVRSLRSGRLHPVSRSAFETFSDCDSPQPKENTARTQAQAHQVIRRRMEFSGGRPQKRKGPDVQIKTSGPTVCGCY